MPAALLARLVRLLARFGLVVSEIYYYFELIFHYLFHFIKLLDLLSSV